MNLFTAARVRDALINLDRARYVDLYLNDAEFHAALDTIIALLPTVVAKLADDADTRRNHRQIMLATFERGPT